MRLSATMLGSEYGMTGEEMNRLLFKQGILKGEPGDYSLTETGEKYGLEVGHERGTGGYVRYNPRWITRSYDESIRDAITVTPELKAEIRQELSEARARKRAESEAYAAQFYANLSRKSEDTENDNVSNPESNIDGLLNSDAAGSVLLIVGGLALVFAVGYGIYKAVPRIIHWWNERKEKKSRTEEEPDEAFKENV